MSVLNYPEIVENLASWVGRSCVVIARVGGESMSQVVEFSLNSGDGAKLTAYRQSPSMDPKAIVQIAHGVSEHFRRYDHLATALVEAGYAVYGQDHRGHGRSAETYGLGHLGPGGFQALVDDMATLSEVAHGEHPGLPLVLVAHSMGSFAAPLYLAQHPHALAALVLSGTAALDKLLEGLMATGAPHVGLDLLNAAFEPERTAFDWLSRDEGQVDAYVADPLCGFTPSEDTMGSMFAVGARARLDPRLKNLAPDLPVYVISGEHDPVVGPDQVYAQALIDSLKAAGLHDIVHRVYPGGRHEMFNELNRDEVERDLLAWLGRAV